MDVQEQVVEKKKFSIITSFFKGFGLLLTYELIEELIEEAIAWTITTAVTQALSFLLVVVLTQFTKVTVKAVTKILTVFLKPIIKKALYKPGNDKLKGLAKITNKIFHTNIEIPEQDTKELVEDNDISREKNNQEAIIMSNNEAKVSKFKQFFTNIVEFVNSNKKSILSTATAIVTSIGGGGAVQIWCANTGIPNLYTWLIAVVVGIVAFALTELGISARGWESITTYLANTAIKKDKKNKKNVEKEAAKVIKATQKEAAKLAIENKKKAEAEAEKMRVQEYLNQHPELLNK